MTDHQAENYAAPLAEDPKIIEIAPDLYATKFNRTYFLTFPFNRDALAIIKDLAGAHFDGRQWAISVNKRDELKRAMVRMNEAIGERSVVEPVEKKRALVKVSSGHEKGDIIDHEGDVMRIDGLGRQFTPNKRRGNPNPEPVRYAYLLPATEAEISTWRGGGENAEPLEREADDLPSPR